MGYWKQKMMEEQERGWSSLGEKYVCLKCFEDAALSAFVSMNAVRHKCDYCGRRSTKKPIAVRIDEVMEVIDEGIRSEWGHPDDEGVAYETAEGGYQGEVLDTYDLIYDKLEDPFANKKVADDVISSFTQQGALWCQKDFYGLLPQQLLRYGWEKFVGIVKYSKRYLFSTDMGEADLWGRDEELPPGKFLERLGQIITQIGLVRNLKSGTQIYRVRVNQPKKTFQTAVDLGTPSAENARYSNRMSPAGIPMFYGAFDEKTAVMETFDPTRNKNEVITVGQFRTAREFPVVDLTRVPSIPSIFDAAKRDSRPDIIFLHHFMRDLGAPVTKDGREHIDYVPTQIVTEYIRHLYKHPDYGIVRGILYRSAKGEGSCCVFFFDREQCCDIKRGWAEIKEPYSAEKPKFWLGLDRKKVHRLVSS
jgi:hypothetical protein